MSACCGRSSTELRISLVQQLLGELHRPEDLGASSQEDVPNLLYLLGSHGQLGYCFRSGMNISHLSQVESCQDLVEFSMAVEHVDRHVDRNVSQSNLYKLRATLSMPRLSTWK
jgi:hypothetical protein